MLLLPDGIAVSVEPAAESVHLGYSYQFTAIVSGTAAKDVTWSVDEGPAYGTIDPEGVYTASATLPDPPAATVRAVSVADTSKCGTALVTIYYAGRTPSGFVRVPAGSFTMGDRLAHCGSNLYPVTLTKDFYLGQAEVTNEQYREMVQWAYDHGYVRATMAMVVDAHGKHRATSELVFRWMRALLQEMVCSGFAMCGHGINPRSPGEGSDVVWSGGLLRLAESQGGVRTRLRSHDMAVQREGSLPGLGLPAPHRCGVGVCGPVR